jgi:hypothetical protein
MSTSKQDLRWQPAKWIDGESTVHAVFGEYHQFKGTWSSRWIGSRGEMLNIVGTGLRPSEGQTDTWMMVSSKLDEVIAIALKSLPPWPKKANHFVFFEKPLEIKSSTPTMELFDDGRYTFLFEANKKLDGYDTSGLVEMKQFQVLESEWSC